MAPMAECHMAGYVSAEGAAVGPCNRGSEAPRPIAPPSLPHDAPTHPPQAFYTTWSSSHTNSPRLCLRNLNPGVLDAAEPMAKLMKKIIKT